MTQDEIADLIAYLIVLNYNPVLKKLTTKQYDSGKWKMLGCLHRLCLSLDNDEIINAVIIREKLNCNLPYGNIQLSEATANLANMIYNFINQDSPWKVGLND